MSIDPGSTRAKILNDVNPDDFRWALPIMRTGYSGRGLVYTVVAGLSLWSIWRGGEAQGTQSAMQSLSGTWGTVILIAIAVGMFAYAIWRLVDAIWDLEAYGTEAKGLVARAGMIVTGLAHAGIGVLALGALGWMQANSGGGEGGGSSSYISAILQMPGGVWIVGIAGLLTLAAGGYYIRKAVKQDYLDSLAANRVTRHLNLVLQIGVAAQGVVVGVIGGLILYAALRNNPEEAGGLDAVFEWLRDQPYGQVLVTVLCLGLLGFALFCFVNAAYRIIPKAYDGDTPSLTTYQNR
ncbi:DUF1206 domain-containing protein [Rhodobacterales bacterium HKCCE4037]|nr:DUF1206 domain-containing protein [Rhodobacterales bacterium HKCCE4037]